MNSTRDPRSRQEFNTMKTFHVAGLIAAAITLSLASHTAGAAPSAAKLAATNAATTAAVDYRTIAIDGVNVFYREAGPKDAPVLLLLHGFPTSSQMYQGLMPLLADRYHLVAPDYPGFGLSDAPPPAEFAYSFDHLTQVMDDFTRALGLKRYSLYL